MVPPPPFPWPFWNSIHVTTTKICCTQVFIAKVGIINYNCILQCNAIDLKKTQQIKVLKPFPIYKYIHQKPVKSFPKLLSISFFHSLQRMINNTCACIGFFHMCGGFDLEFNFMTPLLVGANVPIKFVIMGEFVLFCYCCCCFFFWLNFGTSKFNIQKLRNKSTDEKKILTKTI